MNCKLHQNQRKSGTLCGSAECDACLAFRRLANAPQAPDHTGKWYGIHMPQPSPQPTYAEPAPAPTQLDREVAADRALYIERRVMLAGMAMQGLLAEGVSDGGAWRQRREDAIAQRAVAHADALLTALFPTKFPSE